MVERLRARRSEIDNAIFERVSDLAPEAVGLTDPEYLAGLRAAVTAVVDYGLTGYEQNTGSPAMIPSAAVTQAHRAARAGVDLGTVLRRYVAGHAVLEDFVVQEADCSEFQGQRTVLPRILATSALLLDRLITSIISAYMQAEQAGSIYGAPAGEHRNNRARVADRAQCHASNGYVAQDQRVRIMRALTEILAERGFARATVGLVVSRARVSTRTFYQLFAGLEECLIAIMDSVLEQSLALASRELLDAACWQDGVRSILAAILTFFDREPKLARVCIVETLAGGPTVLTHRERLIEAFRLLVIERVEREVPQISPLAAEGVTSLVLGIMHAHIVADKPGPFTELLGPLLGLTMAPYLGARDVRREIEQGDQLAQAILNGDSRWSPRADVPQSDTELDAGPYAVLSSNLGNVTARRLRECLLFLVDHPNSSNREVGIGMDLVHQSQVSRLLNFLLREGLATKSSEGKGKRNAWRLTSYGAEVAQAPDNLSTGSRSWNSFVDLTNH
jgi:AcrR family transcriptional regulator